jgi:hypothetical protein
MIFENGELEFFGNLNNIYIGSFFRFVDDLTARGIILMLSYPSCETEAFLKNIETVHAIDAACRTKENLFVISRPEDYSFSKDLCYDAIYHLNAKGRKLRTARLIADIEKNGTIRALFPNKP